MPTTDEAGTTPDAAQHGSEAASGPEPTYENPQWALSRADVAELREMYATGDWTQAELAAMFKVGKATVSLAIRFDKPDAPALEPAARVAYVASHGEAYRPGLQVRVRVPKLARDPRNGETGTVQRNYNDGGEMVHVVVFEDGTTAEYNYHDLASKQQGKQYD